MNSSGNKKLLAVPAVVAVIGLVLLIIGLLSGSTLSPKQISNGSTVQLSGGFSIYSKSASDRTATTCNVDGTTLGRPTKDFSVSADGTKYYEVARSTVAKEPSTAPATPARCMPASVPTRSAAASTPPASSSA